MKRFIRRPSPSMAVALAALLVAMTGTAISARHYVVTSTHQIAPKVLKKLRGKTGPRGPQGPSGEAGPAGPLTTTLPRGQTLRGVFEFRGNAEVKEEVWGFDISFGMTLASPPVAQVISPSGPATAQCAGSSSNPTAAPGYLCVYEAGFSLTKSLTLCAPSRANCLSPAENSADAFGTRALVQSLITGPFSIHGTWAVTGN
jgi:hypothetical protein